MCKMWLKSLTNSYDNVWLSQCFLLKEDYFLIKLVSSNNSKRSLCKKCLLHQMYYADNYNTNLIKKFKTIFNNANNLLKYLKNHNLICVHIVVRDSIIVQYKNVMTF